MSQNIASLYCTILKNTIYLLHRILLRHPVFTWWQQLGFNYGNFRFIPHNTDKFVESE